jgi:hypothetical protein
MKQFGFLLALMIISTACGPAPTPAPTPDANATMSAFSGTMVAATLTAQPTNTSVPTNTPLPSETATSLPTETATLPAATATLDPLAPVATLDPALPMVPTATKFVGQFAPGSLEGLPVALLRVENLSGVKEIIITLNGTTRVNQLPVYLAYKITGSLNINIYLGTWQYKVEIPNKRFLTGVFKQTNKDKTTMKVYLTKIAVLGP